MSRAAGLVAIAGLLILGAVDGWLWSATLAGVEPAQAPSSTLPPDATDVGIATGPPLNGVPRDDLLVSGPVRAVRGAGKLPLIDASLFRRSATGASTLATFTARVLGSRQQGLLIAFHDSAAPALMRSTTGLLWGQPSQLRVPIPSPNLGEGGDRAGAAEWFVTLEFEPIVGAAGARWLSVEALLRDNSGEGRLRPGIRSRLPFPEENPLLFVLPDPYGAETDDGRPDALLLLIEAHHS